MRRGFLHVDAGLTWVVEWVHRGYMDETETRDSIIKHGSAMYSRFGWDNDMADYLLEILNDPDGFADPNDPSSTANRFRMSLWMSFQGGYASAVVTRQVFADLGRLNECDPEWV